MSSFLEKKKQKAAQFKKENPEQEVPAVDISQEPSKLVSDGNPNAPVSELPTMSFQRNKYQRDVFQAAADKLEMSVNEYLRVAALEKAARMGIS